MQTEERNSKKREPEAERTGVCPGVRTAEELEPVHERLRNAMGFTVRAARCGQCLFGKERLIDGADAARKLKTIRQNGTYFACHEYTDFGADANAARTGYDPVDVCCRGFYDELGDDSQQVRMAEGMGLVRFVNANGIVVRNPESDIMEDSACSQD